MKILFSGRLDPPHLSHVAQILRLLKKFDEVIVVIFCAPDRRFPIKYCTEILSEIFEDSNVTVLTNTTHFGKITKNELTKFDFDVYASGNLSVLRHIESMGYQVIYTERAYAYTASDIPLPK